MSAAAVEQLLARLYTDEPFRRAFLDAPLQTARDAGLDEAEAQALAETARIDRDGLVMAAHSYARKRAAHAGKGGGWSARLRSLFRL